MMKKTGLFLLILFITTFAFTEVVKTFPDLMRPGRIMVDKDKLYILEFPHIYIYSLDDFRLIKKFGRQGEGPQEFMGGLNITAYTDHIIVNSQGKISYWTKTGEFIREKKCPFAGGVEPLGADMYVGNGFRRGDTERDKNYNTIDLYDSNFKKIREIDRTEASFQNRGFTVFAQTYYFINSRTKNMIYVIGKEGFEINVFDENAKKLFTIKEDYKTLNVTKADEKEAHEYFKKTFPRLYEANKHLIKFADYKPAIRNFLEYDKKVYVETYHVKDGKVEFYVFGQDGKLLKRVFLPIVKQDFRTNYPYFIDGGKLYHLVESEDEELWELRVTEVD
jgi:hypothetical protein